MYNNDLIVFILIRKILSGSKRALNKVHKELDSRKRIRFLFCWLNYDIFEFILIYTAFADQIDEAILNSIDENYAFMKLLLENDQYKNEIMKIFTPEIFRQMKEGDD